MKMSRIYLLFGCLCAALVYNALVHLKSPAYRFYRDEVSRLRSEMEDYKKKINEGLVLSLVEAYSNTLNSASLASPLSAKTETPKKLGVIAAQPGFVRGSYVFVYNHFPFRVGDSFLDGTILAIDPTCFWTDRGYYVFSPPDCEDGTIHDSSNDSSDHDET